MFRLRPGIFAIVPLQGDYVATPAASAAGSAGVGEALIGTGAVEAGDGDSKQAEIHGKLRSMMDVMI